MSACDAPEIPDFHICHESYGTGLVPSLCIVAAADLSGGTAPEKYTLTEPGEPMNLPFSVHYGECHISVEAAGSTLPLAMAIVPDDIISMASDVIHKCVFNKDGIGGFATRGFSNMLSHVIRNQVEPDNPLLFPASTAFLTVTVGRPAEGQIPYAAPGDTDITIPLVTAGYLELQSDRMEPGRPILKYLYKSAGQAWRYSAKMMRNGVTRNWWDTNPGCIAYK